jgi:hypothetical protein
VPAHVVPLTQTTGEEGRGEELLTWSDGWARDLTQSTDVHPTRCTRSALISQPARLPSHCCSSSITRDRRVAQRERDIFTARKRKNKISGNWGLRRCAPFFDHFLRINRINKRSNTRPTAADGHEKKEKKKPAIQQYPAD